MRFIMPLRHWLNAIPIADPFELRLARTLQLMQIGLVTAATIGLPITLLFRGNRPLLLLSIAAQVLVIATSLAAMGLVRAGRFHSAVTLTAGGILGGLAMHLTITGISRSAGIILVLALPLAVVALWSGRRGLLVIASICVALVLAIAALESRTPPLAGLLPPPGYPLHLMAAGIALTVILLAFFLERYQSTLRATLTDLHQANDRLRVELTERARVESQLLQSQKMEGIGRLAGGVAHDFNNLLVAINGYAQLAADELPPEHPARPDLHEIRRATDRAANLTRQLLAFARRQISDQQVMSLNDLLADMDSLLRRIIREDIALVACPAPNLWPIRADPVQLEQVLVNLVVNARDAMPYGGQLTLETANVDLDERYAASHAAVDPGAYVMLAVSDTGVGIDPATQPHIFEPFFTTKGPGEGTGLGLATCYGIVKQHGGNIWVYSELGRGAVFKVYLPRIHEQPAPLARREENDDVPRGTERILLAEDDAAVRELALRVLSSLGYAVTAAANGAEALGLAGGPGEAPFDLLLTDVVMPSVGGRELADQLARRYPGLRVLYMSGYTDTAIVHQGRLAAGVSLLQKPFTPAALARKVRETLDS